MPEDDPEDIRDFPGITKTVSEKQKDATERCKEVLYSDDPRCKTVADLKWIIGVEHEFFMGALEDRNDYYVASNPKAFNELEKQLVFDYDWSKDSGYFIENATCTFYRPGHYGHLSSQAPHFLYIDELNALAEEKFGGGANYDDLDNDQKEAVEELFKKRCFLNRSIEDIDYEIRSLDDAVFEGFRESEHDIAKELRHISEWHGEDEIIIWPYGSIARTITLGPVEGEVSEAVREYAGSYHLSITLPYGPDDSVDERIKMRNRFAKAIQWLEPLLVSHWYGPDVTSIGDRGRFWEGSGRAQMSAHTMFREEYGWPDFGGVYVPGERREREVDDQAEIEFCHEMCSNRYDDYGYDRVFRELWDYVEENIGDFPAIRQKCFEHLLESLMDGCHEWMAEVNPDVPMYTDEGMPNEEYNEEFDDCVEHDFEENYRSGCFEAPFFGVAPELRRTAEWEETFREWAEEWEENCVDECINSGEYQEAMEHVSEEERSDGISPGAKKEFSGRGTAGIEIRIWDNMDSSLLNEVWRHLMLVAIQAKEHSPSSIHDDPEEHHDWKRAMDAVVKEGYNAELPDEYIEKLSEAGLGIDLSDIEDRRAFRVYEHLVKKLWQKNRGDPWYIAMTEHPKREPSFYRWNEQAFDWSIRHMLRNDLSDRDAFVSLLGLLKKSSDAEDCGEDACWLPTMTDATLDDLERIMSARIREEGEEQEGAEEAVEDADSLPDEPMPKLLPGMRIRLKPTLRRNDTFDGLEVLDLANHLDETFRIERPSSDDTHMVKSLDSDFVGWVHPGMISAVERDWDVGREVRLTREAMLERGLTAERLEELDRDRSWRVSLVEPIGDGTYWKAIPLNPMSVNETLSIGPDDVIPEHRPDAPWRLEESSRPVEWTEGAHVRLREGLSWDDVYNGIQVGGLADLEPGAVLELRFQTSRDGPAWRVEGPEGGLWTVTPEMVVSEDRPISGISRGEDENEAEAEAEEEVLDFESVEIIEPVGYETIMDYILGADYTQEDIADVLDFLKRHNVIDVKRSDEGRITEVKPLYHVDEAKKTIDLLASDTEFKVNRLFWKALRGKGRGMSEKHGHPMYPVPDLAIEKL